MPYSPPTYRTKVVISNGPRIGRDNLVTQPSGFIKGLPSPFWCRDSIRWQILFYTDSLDNPADLQGLNAYLRMRKYNAQTTAVTLASIEVGIGDPGYHNSVTLQVTAKQLAELTYSGEQMMLYVELEGEEDKIGRAHV